MFFADLGIIFQKQEIEFDMIEELLIEDCNCNIEKNVI